MALQDILRRYYDYGVVVYGGDQSFIDSLSSNIIVAWINDYGVTLPAPISIPEKLVQIIVTTTGYIDGVRVEIMTSSYLSSAMAIIYHGYPEFKTEGLEVMKEVYTGGCVITSIEGKAYRLQKISSLLPDPVPIPIPFIYTDNMDRLLPYIHIFSRLSDIKEKEGTLRIPVADSPPIQISTTDTTDAIYSSSVYIDKDRKLLLSAIDLSLRASPNFILLYYGDLYIKWTTQFLDLFLLSKGVELHLWGKDQGIQIPESPAIRIRPQDLGDTRPDINAYIRRYGSNPNIVILADEGGEDLLAINPVAAYLPFKEGGKGLAVLIPWTTLGRANLLYLRGDTSRSQVTQGNINYFHYHNRTDSYNMSSIVGVDIGRNIPMPDLGLCTCYDCASEVRIMTRYMQEMDIPFDLDTLKGLLSYNGPSLWPIAKPISRPRDRKNILISSDNIKSLLDLDIYMYGNIGIDVPERLLNSTSLYIEGDIPPMERMRKIIQGTRYPLVVNFHRDFVRNYNIDTDKGRTGKKKYDKFILDVALNRSGLDIWGILLLFILAR